MGRVCACACSRVRLASPARSLSRHVRIRGDVCFYMVIALGLVLWCLLALAGAGDVPNLDRWLHSQPPYVGEGATVLPQLGRGLRAFANEDYRHAATLLRVGMPHLASIGGSDAQRHLFHQITDFAANPPR